MSEQATVNIELDAELAARMERICADLGLPLGLPLASCQRRSRASAACLLS